MDRQHSKQFYIIIFFLSSVSLTHMTPLNAIFTRTEAARPTFFKAATSRVYDCMRFIKNAMPRSQWIRAGIVTATTFLAAWRLWRHVRMACNRRILAERAALNQMHAAQIEQLNQRHRQALEDAIARHDQTINEAHRQELAALAAQHTTAIDRLRQELEAAAQRSHQEIVQIQALHQQEIARINREHQEAIQPAQAVHEVAVAQQAPHNAPVEFRQDAPVFAQHLFDSTDISSTCHQ